MESSAIGGKLSPNKIKKKKMKRGKYFCLIVMAVVIAQWLVFWVYSRLNSVLTSFQYFDIDTVSYRFYSFREIFTNYIKFFGELTNNPNTFPYILNGYFFWGVGWLVSQFSIFIAFYLYKKCRFSGIMLPCLMLPGTLASMANPLMFKFFIEKGLPDLMYKLGAEGDYTLLFSKTETALGLSLIMSVFLSFSGSMLFYVGQFGRTPTELVESAKLDGITYLQEFWYISFPSIFSMWSLGQLTILTAGLTTTGPGYGLYAENGYQYGVVTFQYDILMNVLGASGDPRYYYPYSAAVNMCFAIVTLGGVTLMKRVFEKLDPQAEY